MTRTRHDVWRRTQAEGDWPGVLKAYEHAVGLLRELDPPSGHPTNPMSWSYLAALHGRLRDDGRVDRSNPAWNNCQHGSWFFLPWHRMYLLAFEAIVQHVLKDEHWSLPYWYSLDPDDPTTSVLPPAFRDTKAGNNLYTKHRSQLANGGHQLPPIADTVVDRARGRALQHGPRNDVVRQRRTGPAELRRARDRVARRHAPRRRARLCGQRLRRPRQPAQGRVDGFALPGRARSDLLAAPRQHRPVVGGVVAGRRHPSGPAVDRQGLAEDQLQLPRAAQEDRGVEGQRGTRDSRPSATCTRTSAAPTSFQPAPATGDELAPDEVGAAGVGDPRPDQNRRPRRRSARPGTYHSRAQNRRSFS